MSKGRKAQAGTLEARKFVIDGNIEKFLETQQISADCKTRLLKAIKFGLGVK